MVHRHARDRATTGGFSLAELLVFMAVVGIIFAMAVPSFLTYYQAAVLKSGVQDVIGLINQARGLAVKQNDGVCVELPSATRIRYRLSTCGGTIWVGVGTDGAGNINLPAGFTVTASANPVFTYLGSALPAATYTLTNTTTGATLTVSVALTGRVTSP